MTNPKPDPLFDALRDQLADYGQEPPAHLWAGIRQQLPPPVALPQRRRRRWVPLAMLGLLVMVIGVVSWQAWELSPLRQRTVAGRASVRPRAETSIASGTTSSLPDHTGLQVAVSKSAADAAAAPTAAPAATSQLREGPQLPASAPEVAAVATPGATPTGTARALSTATAALPHAPPSHSTKPAGATVDATETTVAVAAGRSSAVAASIHPAGRAAPKAKKVKDHTLIAATSTAPGEARLSPAHTRPAHSLAVASMAAPPQPPLAATGSVAGTGRQPSAAASSPMPTKAQTLLAALPDQAGAYDQLAPRQPTLPEQPTPAPTAPQPLTVRRSATPRPPAARWAVQTLAGPARTGVRLGAVPKVAGNVPTNVVSTVTAAERPATSGGIQFSLRRTLGAHWSLSAGLGIGVYATRNTLSQRVPLPPTSAGSSLDPAARKDTTIIVSQYRKTYEVFTLPVRLGYAWQPTGRWQLGLLAGADVIMLNRIYEAWALPYQLGMALNSPKNYHQFSLGTSLGLEARYHFSPRCELLAQPTFTYQLTPLQKDRDGVASRHLWGAALLLGVAYENPLVAGISLWQLAGQQLPDR